MLNKYREVFPNKLSLLAVIHCEKNDPEHAMRNADIAFNAGADGIWLINHPSNRAPDFRAKDLMRIYDFVREEFPDQWIGVNFLGTNLNDIMKYIVPSVNGIWTDNARVDGTDAAQEFLKQKNGWDGLYFGGTAFKYTRTVNDDPAEAAKRAMPFMDVITTSGAGTNSAPDVTKLKAMREAVGDFPIANASGNKISNVVAFGEYVDCLITASSVLVQKTRHDDPDEFDPHLLGLLATEVKKFNG